MVNDWQCLKDVYPTYQFSSPFYCSHVAFSYPSQPAGRIRGEGGRGGGGVMRGLIRPLRLCSSLDEALLIPANNEVDLWFLYYLMFYKNILKYILYLERDILKYNYFW